jgi:hypothetical protein
VERLLVEVLAQSPRAAGRELVSSPV